MGQNHNEVHLSYRIGNVSDTRDWRLVEERLGTIDGGCHIGQGQAKKVPKKTRIPQINETCTSCTSRASHKMWIAQDEKTGEMFPHTPHSEFRTTKHTAGMQTHDNSTAVQRIPVDKPADDRPGRKQPDEQHRTDQHDRQAVGSTD